MHLLAAVKMSNMEDLVKEMGFNSVQEFNHLVATVDISTPQKLKAFEDWKENDGTKEGLLKLFEAS